MTIDGPPGVGRRGERRAAIAGMSLATSAIDIFRAGLEAVALRLAAVYTLLAPLAPPGHAIVASGGALGRSRAWTKIIADAIGRPVAWSHEEQATSRGAALLALQGLGLAPDLRAHGNRFAFGMIGRSLPGRHVSVGASVLWNGLHAVDGVDLLYAGSRRIAQSGHSLDVRAAALKGNGGNVRYVQLPLEAHGLKVMSIGFFIKEDEAVVWRGPMLHKTVQHFLGNVLWGELDYLIVDLPPGTGDVALSLAQTVPLTSLRRCAARSAWNLSLCHASMKLCSARLPMSK